MRHINLDTIDLKNERLKSGLTQEILGKRIGKSQSVVARLEANQSQVSLETIRLWLDACGKFQVGNGLSPSSAKMTHLMERHLVVSHAIREILKDLADTEALTSFLSEPLTVPKIAFVGPVDAGKSTAINHLLGEALLPAKWTRTTNSLVMLRHICRRPAGVNKTTYVLNGAISSSELDRKLLDCEYLRAGGSELLDVDHEPVHTVDWGIDATSGTTVDQQARQKTTTVHYENNPLLLACDIMDTPGFGSDEHDNQVAAYALSEANIVVVCHGTNGFIGPQCLEAIRTAARALKDRSRDDGDTLRKLIILITHSAQEVDDQSLLRMREEGVALIEDLIPPNPSGVNIRQRIFPFHPSIPERTSAFKRELITVLQEIVPTEAAANYLAGLSKVSEGIERTVQRLKVERPVDEAKLLHYVESQSEIRRSLKVRLQIAFDEARLRVHDDWNRIYKGVTDIEFVKDFIGKNLRPQSAEKTILPRLQDEISRQLQGSFNQHYYQVNELHHQLSQSFNLVLRTTLCISPTLDLSLGSSVPRKDLVAMAVPLTLLTVLPPALAIAIAGYFMIRNTSVGKDWNEVLAIRVVEATKSLELSRRVTEAIEEVIDSYRHSLERQYGPLAISDLSRGSMLQAEKGRLEGLKRKRESLEARAIQVRKLNLCQVEIENTKQLLQQGARHD